MHKRNTIRNYRDTVSICFKQSGENFTLNVPHYKKWLAIIRFLKKRGFDIKENKYFKEQFGVLSKYHKIGFKKDIALLLEIGNRNITIQFGNIKNLWDHNPQSFWDNKSDERHTKLTYLENIAVRLEINKLLEFCGKYNHEFIDEDSSLSPEQYILKKEKTNPHIHGKIDCLDDIGKSISIDSYNYKHNSNDSNGKKIICGQTKYFYDYHNHLSVGIAYHNINNMWWLISNSRMDNIACFYLFDYAPDLPKRKPITENQLLGLIEKFEKKKHYLKCHTLQKLYDSIKR